MIAAYQEQLKNGEHSAQEKVQEYLDTITQQDEQIHAFLQVHADEALSRAKDIDERKDYDKPLSGVPVAIKDNILIQGKPATAGSKILERYTAAYDATVIKRLHDAGAIVIGKTNLDEFAMGSSTEFSAFGGTKNPLDTSLVPGGSSGGSAAAVAADMAMVALGSDTGGSIRQPAAFCGVAGFKPTYGAVSRYGLIALASSLDQIGPFAKDVEDIARTCQVMAGHDPYDATSLSETIDWTTQQDITTLRIGVPKEYFVEGLDPDIASAVQKKVAWLEQQGCSVQEVSLPHTQYALSVYYIIMPAESSANLARFDGIRYARLEELQDAHLPLQELYKEQREKGIGDEPTRRILLGTFVLSSGYYDAYYAKAQKVRTLIKQDFDTVFEKVDALITPVTPTTAFPIGAKTDDPLSMYLSDIFTIPTNLAGLPGLSLPTGAQDKRGLPIGMQIIGPHKKDGTVLALGEYIQSHHTT